MKKEIELAKQAGWEYADDDRGFEPLWDFAELVRADEREKYKWDVHSCGPNCTKVACVAMREAIAAEREACAKVCEELLERPSGYQGTWEGYGKFKTQMTGQECAAAIRARSNT